MYGPPKATGFRVVTIDSEGQNTLQGTVTLPKLENAITRAGISELIAQTTGLEHAKYDLVGKSENGKQLQLTCDEVILLHWGLTFFETMVGYYQLPIATLQQHCKLGILYNVLTLIREKNCNMKSSVSILNF